MNLLDETKSAISQSEHSTDDVRFVGSRDEKLGIPWSQAEKVLDIDYDDGYGGQEIAADLVVAFTDGGFLRREEYDGSEWWEYEPPFRVPETQKPFGRVKRTYPAYSLEDRPADLDWENAEPKELDNRLVEAVTKGGTIVRGRTVAVQGSLDQLIVEGVLQPLLIRFPGEHWRLANGWKTLNFYKRKGTTDGLKSHAG